MKPTAESRQTKVCIHLFINIKQPGALNFIISLFQASTYFEKMCSSSGGQKLYYTVSLLYNFCPPDDKHMCSKHVEA